MSVDKENLEEWIIHLKVELDRMKKLKPNDRLELVAAIERCMRILNASSSGWLNWSNQPSLMNLYKEDDLREMYGLFRDLASGILMLNIKYGSDILLKSKKQKKIDSETYII